MSRLPQGNYLLWSMCACVTVNELGAHATVDCEIEPPVIGDRNRMELKAEGDSTGMKTFSLLGYSNKPKGKAIIKNQVFKYIFFVTSLSIQESSFSVAFKKLDLDNNGEIDKNEYKEVMALVRAQNRQGVRHRDGLRVGLKVSGSVENGGLLERKPEQARDFKVGASEINKASRWERGYQSHPSSICFLHSKPSSNINCGMDPSNPHFVHHSDHPGHLFIPIKLNGANYPSWSKSMIHAVTAKNKIGFINGSIEQLSEKDQPTEYALSN
ncbi:hypothetical protein RJ639_042434 [Escallonia herrerae]|uniref:EF-hand domain-containing protein n=1 Tax=Escallonia herrerae TaxID=1293975 RepID=A0AA88WHD8_9ASTE|nr:hypothetical protein RJ639_042434 [Escallonia herrerae]